MTVGLNTVSSSLFNTLNMTYEISHTLSVLFSHKLTCTSHPCGQWLPSVHRNFNAAS